MATEAGRAHVRRLVSGHMSREGWNPGDLARRAGIDPGTAGDFLSGARWPKIRTLGKIEKALGVQAGKLTALAEGEDLDQDELDLGGGAERAVSGAGQDAPHVMLDVGGAFDDLNETERQEAIAAAQAVLLQRAREIRSQRGK
jgi:transcriptional regulator with XRE-family HTH domain